MRRIFWFASAVVLVLAVSLCLVHANGPADMPAGVSAAYWRPLADGVGLVLKPGSGGEIGGYLMAKVGDRWQVVTLFDPAAKQVLPAR